MQETSSLNLNNTSSISPPTFLKEVTASLDYETRGESRLMTILYKKVEGLEQEVIDLKTKKIIDETQFPVNMLEQNGLIPHKPMKLKRGRGYRPIFRSEIEEAKTHSPFATRQAKWLGVHPRTYRKYCRMYNIWDPHPNEKGKRNLFSIKPIADNMLFTPYYSI